jgi:hypothetical protein
MQPETPKTDDELLRHVKDATAHMIYAYLVEVRKQPESESRVVALAVGTKAAKEALAEMNWWKAW